MKRKNNIFYTIGIALLLLYCTSCNDQTKVDELPLDRPTSITLYSNISSLRATETSWEGNDQIGLFAVESGKGLTSASIYKQAHNLPYITKGADGIFVPVEGKGVELWSGDRIDLVSYYPYQAVGSDHKLRLNIKDQSDLSKIDLLYSDNVRGLTNTNATARLVFDHMLSQLQITVKTEGAGIDLGGLTVKLSGVLTDGVFDLAEGAVTSVGTTANEVTMFATSNSTNSAVRTAMLLPGQEIKNLQYTFEIGGDSYTYQEETSRLMQPGTKEKRTFEIHSNGVKLLDATIDIWEKGDENTVPGEEVPEQPDPLPTPDEFSNSAYYMEQVLIGKGEMEDVYIQQHNAPDSYFKSGTTPGGSRRNYTIYYSKENRLPYMVSYPMYYDCVGSVDRTNAWAYDPEIPRQYQMNLTKAYISGYSRGHMLASNNRRATEALNETTFYFTNMIPQNGNQNSGIWQQLEGRENDWAKNALKTDTMYVVCGPTLMPGAGTVRDVDGKTCPIPSHTWKVLLKKKGGQWISIAAKMPNVAPPKGAKWFDYTCTVADIERELGVKFFPFLSEEESKTVKSMNNSDDW